MKKYRDKKKELTEAPSVERPAEPQGTSHHPCRPRVQQQGGAPELIREMWFFIYTEGTMKGQNECQCLVIGSTELCRKSCLGDYCKIHLACLRRGPGTQPCMVCGKGVKNRFKLCEGCGYHKAQIRAWYRDHKALMAEFQLLTSIQISI